MAAAALMAMPLALNAQTNYYVKAPHDLTPATPEGTADGSSWDKAISLQQALAKVKAGDCIFAKGYTAGEATGKDFYYTVHDRKGFVLPSGVRMYGGFAGNETEISPDNLDTQANDPRGCVGSDLSHMKYRSVLTADIYCNDTVSDTWLLFPQNSTRKDNASHVVTMSLAPTAVNPNAGNDPTVLNGFYIVGGNASDSDDSYGGGVYITDAGTADNNTGERGYDVSRCFFTNNYAERGGAIYVAANVKPNANRRAYIRYNTLFNNVAGTRGADDNLGGGLWAEGRADIVNNLVYCNINGGMRVSEATTVVNNTISRNNSAGIDHVSPDKNNKLTVYNTIVWGNHRLNKYSPAPHFSHGAYYTHRGEANPGDDTNVVLEESNNAADGATPNFKDPVTSARYDRSYIWTTTDYPQWSYAIDYGSALIAKGDPTQYKSATWGDRALSADNRFGTADNNTTTIDIGAYAYTKVPASRRRYVKTAANGGNDDNDGLTWATAYASPQKAIDALNDGTGQRGEVWVQPEHTPPAPISPKTPTAPWHSSCTAASTSLADSVARRPLSTSATAITTVLTMTNPTAILNIHGSSATSIAPYSRANPTPFRTGTAPRASGSLTADRTTWCGLHPLQPMEWARLTIRWQCSTRRQCSTVSPSRVANTPSNPVRSAKAICPTTEPECLWARMPYCATAWCATAMPQDEALPCTTVADVSRNALYIIM